MSIIRKIHAIHTHSSSWSVQFEVKYTTMYNACMLYDCNPAVIGIDLRNSGLSSVTHMEL